MTFSDVVEAIKGLSTATKTISARRDYQNLKSAQIEQQKEGLKFSANIDELKALLAE